MPYFKNREKIFYFSPEIWSSLDSTFFTTEMMGEDSEPWIIPDDYNLEDIQNILDWLRDMSLEFPITDRPLTDGMITLTYYFGFKVVDKMIPHYIIRKNIRRYIAARASGETFDDFF